MKHNILIVDDEQDNLDALERLFRKKYQVFKAISGEKGLEILKNQDVSLIISDQRMPQMQGVEFLRRSIETHPEAIRILLTGYTDVESIIGAINTGEVYRYINKPWDPVDLVNTVDKAIERFELRMELEKKNKELQAALKELKNLDEAKNHFMVLINHELKTPLTSLLSFLELLTESPLTEEQQKFLNRIEKSALQLKTIIDNVLELVSAETGVLKVKLKKIKPEHLKKMVLEALPSGHEDELEITMDNTTVVADPQHLQSILNRLLDNAFKFKTPKTKVSFLVQKQGPQVQISIKNQGKGLSKDVIQKVLKPFSLDENILHHSKGLGLGLSLCQALLKAQNSQLHLSSEKNTITASFLLPEK
ncbi:MAG: hybrid sensor histidine kinase/response regulator [Bdellovibrio sp.]|nr:MAG: hybrid sensor histidine kinase/response regulator [Bdellovibrio sp.]